MITIDGNSLAHAMAIWAGAIGTIEQPQQDLSPRIGEVSKESPWESLGLIFRQFGEWLKAVFGGE